MVQSILGSWSLFFPAHPIFPPFQIYFKAFPLSRCDLGHWHFPIRCLVDHFVPWPGMAYCQCFRFRQLSLVANHWRILMWLTSRLFGHFEHIVVFVLQHDSRNCKSPGFSFFRYSQFAEVTWSRGKSFWSSWFRRSTCSLCKGKRWARPETSKRPCNVCWFQTFPEYL